MSDVEVSHPSKTPLSSHPLFHPSILHLFPKFQTTYLKPIPYQRVFYQNLKICTVTNFKNFRRKWAFQEEILGFVKKVGVLERELGILEILGIWGRGGKRGMGILGCGVVNVCLGGFGREGERCCG
ncbi:unnamed protein product [Moneuplotes crassus]|uniref:Uncharacterized protein n=1 Tax=Euplotes crassus TaxID=5936 RepID=A0AAD1UKB6_EUPCR|nr:unnamed protein product [Moneuplotes crassus]